MPPYEYTVVPAKFEELLKKIQRKDIGVPNKATVSWLMTLGYKSKNDRSMIKVLKAIGFVDNSGKPTDLWRQYRGTNHKQVMAHAVHQGYKELFDIYPDACAQPDDKLDAFFGSHTDAGAQVIGKTAGTFKLLCSLADTSAIADIEETVPVEPEKEHPKKQKTPQKEITREQGHGVTVNINIQLALPESMDAKGYAEFFAALKEHILDEDYGTS